MVSLNRNGRVLWRRSRAVVLGLAVMLAFGAATADAAASQQKTFPSPEQAVSALVAASRDGKPAELVQILGPVGSKLVYSGDPVADRDGREKFIAAYDAKHEISQEGDARAVLAVGKEEWPFPIPVIKQGVSWRFDTKAGAQEILDRRIGANELNAIEVCRAYADAQEEYAANGLSDSKLSEYAQKFTSSPGKHDGLYWPVEEGQAASPMGPLVAQARAEGYGPRAKGADRKSVV